MKQANESKDKAPELDVPTASIVHSLMLIDTKLEVLIRLQSAILAHLTKGDKVKIANEHIETANELLLEQGAKFNEARQKAHQRKSARR